MPEKLKCPSCGGTDVRPLVITGSGRVYHQCYSIVERERGQGNKRMKVKEACKFWTTREDVWLNKSC